MVNLEFDSDWVKRHPGESAKDWILRLGNERGARSKQRSQAAFSKIYKFKKLIVFSGFFVSGFFLCVGALSVLQIFGKSPLSWSIAGCFFFLGISVYTPWFYKLQAYLYLRKFKDRDLNDPTLKEAVLGRAWVEKAHIYPYLRKMLNVTDDTDHLSDEVIGDIVFLKSRILCF